MVVVDNIQFLSTECVVGDINIGQCFQIDNQYFMVVNICNNLIRAVNLCTAAIRIFDATQNVLPIKIQCEVIEKGKL